MASIRTLQTTITARDAGCPQDNRLQRLYFDRRDTRNELIDLPDIPGMTVWPPLEGAANLIGRRAEFTVTLPPGTAQFTFGVRRETPDAPTTVAALVTDGCGNWPTFIGGGNQAGF